ncbi:MAG: hypothetical protein AAGK37_05265 [Pseudomonadota bacterium]
MAKSKKLSDKELLGAFADLLGEPVTVQPAAPEPEPIEAEVAAVTVPDLDPMLEPRDLLLDLDAFEIDLELEVPNRASLADAAHTALSLGDGSDEDLDDLADLLALGAAISSRLRFENGAPCPLEPADADEIGLSVAEFETANFVVRGMVAGQTVVATNFAPTLVGPSRVGAGLYIATAVHHGVVVHAFIGGLLRLLFKLLQLLWKIGVRAWNARKRLKAANRLRGRWAREVAKGTMTRAEQIRKLAGLINKLKVEIAAIVATLAELALEIANAEKALEDAEDSDTKSEIEDTLRKLREQMNKLEQEKAKLEAEKSAAEQEQQEAQEQSGD